MKFCNHVYKYDHHYFGLVDYGGTIVKGTHSKYACSHCGKLKWKIQKGYEVVRKRKDGLSKHYQLYLW